MALLPSSATFHLLQSTTTLLTRHSLPNFTPTTTIPPNSLTFTFSKATAKEKPKPSKFLIINSLGGGGLRRLKIGREEMLHCPEVAQALQQFHVLKRNLPPPTTMEFGSGLDHQRSIQALEAYGKHELLTPVDFGDGHGDGDGLFRVYKGPAAYDRVYIKPLLAPSTTALQYGFLCLVASMTAGWSTARVLSLPASDILDVLAIEGTPRRELEDILVAIERAVSQFITNDGY